MPDTVFTIYKAKRGSDTLKDWSGTNIVDPVNSAFIAGTLSSGRTIEDLSAQKESEIALDMSSGNLRALVDGREKWFRPSLPCPDCQGRIELRKKFFKIGSPSSPWKYLCSRSKEGCKTVFAANKPGSLSGDAPNAETRKARKLTTDMFQRLWQEAPDIINFAGEMSEMKGLVNTAKARAYRLLAAKMEQEGCSEGSIHKMDIPTLRIAYRICRDTDVSEVMSY